MATLAQRVATRYLRILAQQEQQAPPEEAPEGEFGGKGPFTLPPDHVAAIQVPKGGANCAKCAFVDEANHAGGEPNYIAWNGGDPALPDLPLDEICSDWFKAGVATEAEGSGQT